MDFNMLNIKPRKMGVTPSLLVSMSLLVIISLLVGCETAENDNQTPSPTAAPTDLPTPTTGTQPEATALPDPVEPTETAVEPTVQPTTPPELVATETPATPEPEPVSAIQLTLVAGGFERPTFLTHAGDGRLFVSDQVGRIHIIENGEVLPAPFLDIRDRIGSEALEQGLLSVAFHPEYAQNGRFYANYTNLNGDTVISRFQVNAADPNSADPASETNIMTLEQPFANHNGGQLKFGPDGYLYIGMGDGGSANDPEGNGQNPSNLLGALLRIDVDNGDPYAIPSNNPFAGDPDRADEIWAYGLRNPWRFSFDRLTGDLYLADVGQRTWEEINYQPAASDGGENYGWNTLEGNHCFENAGCDSAGTILPVAEYDHGFGCSVTGGYIYRGSQFPALTANYFFADYCSGIIWRLFRHPEGDWSQEMVLESGRTISSFGEDVNGELYLLDHADGAVLQIQSVN